MDEKKINNGMGIVWGLRIRPGVEVRVTNNRILDLATSFLKVKALGTVGTEVRLSFWMSFSNLKICIALRKGEPRGDEKEVKKLALRRNEVARFLASVPVSIEEFDQVVSWIVEKLPDCGGPGDEEHQGQL